MMSTLVMISIFLSSLSTEIVAAKKSRYVSHLPVAMATKASSSPAQPIFIGRRAFLASTSTMIASEVIPNHAAAIAPDVTQSMKVTPIAHTYVLGIGTSPPALKPLRENDATRFLTNARLVLPFYGGGDSTAGDLMIEIIDKTVARKVALGPGVTPGKVRILPLEKGSVSAKMVLERFKGSDEMLPTSKSLSATILSLPPGDVALATPRPSGGTAADARIVRAAATECGIFEGGSKGGGVVGLLINGPRAPDTVKVSEGGETTCTILWYNF